MKDAEGYLEDTKTAAQVENGYTHKTERYVTEAQTSRPSLYRLGKRWGSDHTWLEAPWIQDSNPTKDTSFQLLM
jgi:hypothetical protein